VWFLCQSTKVTTSWACSKNCWQPQTGQELAASHLQPATNCYSCKDANSQQHSSNSKPTKALPKKAVMVLCNTSFTADNILPTPSQEESWCHKLQRQASAPPALVVQQLLHGQQHSFSSKPTTYQLQRQANNKAPTAS